MWIIVDEQGRRETAEVLDPPKGADVDHRQSLRNRRTTSAARR
jgi:hypothetical protein